MAIRHNQTSKVQKIFLCLKLNTQLEVQDKGADEIAELFLKRRWLNYIKAGSQYLKERRKDRHRASIFRFLSLQKRAINALMENSVKSQEMRIKKEFAMQLYYNRLLDVALSSLRVYKNYKVNSRIERRASRHSEAASFNPAET